MRQSDKKRRDKSRLLLLLLLLNAEIMNSKWLWKKVFRFRQKVFHFIFCGLFPWFFYYFQFQPFNWNNNERNEWMCRERLDRLLLSRSFPLSSNKVKVFCSFAIVQLHLLFGTMDNVHIHLKLHSAPFFIHFFFSLSTAIVHLFLVQCNRS